LAYDFTFAPGTHKEYKYIADRYEKYGRGVWHFKPCLHIKTVYDMFVLPFNGTFGCGSWINGYCVGNYYLGDLVAPPTMNSHTVPGVPGRLWSDLASKLDSKLPSMKGQMPDLFVFFAELRDIGRMLGQLEPC
jgi:hypothetical protein